MASFGETAAGGKLGKRHLAELAIIKSRVRPILIYWRGL
jgi:hypothetical protein